MPRTDGGGQATTTRSARTVPRSVCTSTWLRALPDRRTGGVERDPVAELPGEPERHELGAADEAAVLGGVVGCRRSARRCRRCSRCPRRRCTRRGTAARSPRRRCRTRPGCSRAAGRGRRRWRCCAAPRSSKVCRSHSAAFGCDHGALTSISEAIWSMRSWSCPASGRIAGSGGIVPVYGIASPLLDVDVVAGDVALEGLDAAAPRRGRGCGPASGRRRLRRPRSPTRSPTSSLSSRPPTRSRASTTSTEAPRRRRLRAATSPDSPAPTTTTSTRRGSEPAGRRRLGRGSELPGRR